MYTYLSEEAEARRDPKTGCDQASFQIDPVCLRPGRFATKPHTASPPKHVWIQNAHRSDRECQHTLNINCPTTPGVRNSLLTPLIGGALLEAVELSNKKNRHCPFRCEKFQKCRHK